MEKLKKIFILSIMLLLIFCATAPPSLTSSAEESEPTTQPEPYLNSYEFEFPERELSMVVDYTATSGVTGEVFVEAIIETNKETLKKFEKYTRKKVDSGDVGEVIYITTSYSNELDKEQVSPTYLIKIKLPKFYAKKELAVIPFTDYRTPQKLRSVKVDKDGCITFAGYSNMYAFAIVYNGAYKDIILIGIIMLTFLILCIVIKVLCVRKDNPYIKEKKTQKAIQKKKAEHKKNKKLAQNLKREKERLKEK